MSDVPVAAADLAPVRWVPAREGYDRWAETYDTDGNPLIALEERHIGSLVGEVGGRIVADVGCGTGRHAVRLAAGGAQSHSTSHRACSRSRGPRRAPSECAFTSMT